MAWQVVFVIVSCYLCLPMCGRCRIVVVCVGPGKLGVAGSFTTRLVWTPPVPDRLQWGDLVTRKVLGFVLMQDVVHVQEGQCTHTHWTTRQPRERNTTTGPLPRLPLLLLFFVLRHRC